MMIALGAKTQLEFINSDLLKLDRKDDYYVVYKNVDYLQLFVIA